MLSIAPDSDGLDSARKSFVDDFSGLLLVTKILGTFSFKEHVGRSIEEEEVGQILNLLLESSILAVEAFLSTQQPIADKLRKSLGYQVH
jgi:hypothetical protein